MQSKLALCPLPTASIIFGHSSPVSARISVKNAVPTDMKLAWWSSSPLSLTSANRYTPRMAYMNMMRRSKLPMFTIPGRVTKKVMKVPLSARFLLKRRNNLAILKDLMMVVWGPKLNEEF